MWYQWRLASSLHCRTSHSNGLAPVSSVPSVCTCYTWCINQGVSVVSQVSNQGLHGTGVQIQSDSRHRAPVTAPVSQACPCTKNRVSNKLLSKTFRAPFGDKAMIQGNTWEGEGHAILREASAKRVIKRKRGWHVPLCIASHGPMWAPHGSSASLAELCRPSASPRGERVG